MYILCKSYGVYSHIDKNILTYLVLNIYKLEYFGMNTRTLIKYF